MAASAYTLAVDDTSPQIIYEPQVDLTGSSDARIGWKVVDTASDTPSQPRSVAKNESWHVTSLDGARMSIEWTGTGVQLLGNITNAAYDVLLDGQLTTNFNSSTSNGSLVDLDGLPNVQHTLTLVTRTNNASTASVAVDLAILKARGPIWSTSTYEEVVDDRALAFSGRWSYAQTPETTTHTTSSTGDFSLLRFNGTGISVRGYRNAASGRYQVALDDEVSIFDGRYASQTEQPVTLFYRTGLDPLTPHVLNVTNMDPRLLAISHVTLITVAGVPPSKGSSLTGGALVGTVIGCMLAAILLLTLLFYWLQRRRHRAFPTVRERFSNLIHSRQRRSSCFHLWRRDTDVESVGRHSMTFEPEKVVMAEGREVAPFEYPRPPREYAQGNRRVSAGSLDEVIDISPQRPEEIVAADSLLRPNHSALLDTAVDAHPYLAFARPSPFVVDFDGSRRPTTTPNASTTLMQPAHAAGVALRNTVHSFLDLASSISSSSRRNPARHSRSSSGSALSALPIPARTASHSRGDSSSSPSFPYPLHSPAPRRGHGGGSGSSPEATDEPPSPGHSIPHTVSDIHFRPADDLSDSEGTRTRPASGHPPLAAHAHAQAAFARSPASPVILQHLMRAAGPAGLHPGSPWIQGARAPPSGRRQSARKSLVAGPRSLPKPPGK